MRTGSAIVVSLAVVILGMTGCEKSDSDTVYSVLDEEVSADLGDQDTTQFHLNASKQNPDNCVGCHGDKKDETNLIGGTTYHSRHAQITISYTCIQCHTSVDLVEGSGGGLRKQVPVSLCQSCHGAAGPGPRLYQTQ